MKKIITIILGAVLPFVVLAAITSYSIPLKENWIFTPYSSDHLYPTYLADPLGVRFEASYRTVTYSDIDFSDEINENGSYENRFDIYPGVRLSLFRLMNTETGMGFETEIGLMTPVYMRGSNFDLIGMDGIYYLRFNAQINSWLHLNLSKHHICTHVGDEFTSGRVDSPTDIDPSLMTLPVLDDFRFATSLRPLNFLEDWGLDILTCYAEVGWFMPGSDFLGGRSNYPDVQCNLNFLYGAQLEYDLPSWGKHIGSLFAAVNISTYQQNAYAKNLSIMAGWIIPQNKPGKRLRFAYQYYNGRNLMNQYYDRKEKFNSFCISMDL